MGLLIQTSFDTAQGFAVTSVYCRINRITFDPQTGGQYIITVKPETHISRDRRLEGKLPVTTPGIPELVSLQGEMGNMSYIYGLLKSELVSRGFTVEDVNPDPTPA